MVMSLLAALELGNVIGDLVVQPERALLEELHQRRRGGDHLGERRHIEDRIDGHVLELRETTPACRTPCDRRSGHRGRRSQPRRGCGFRRWPCKRPHRSLANPGTFAPPDNRRSERGKERASYHAHHIVHRPPAPIGDVGWAPHADPSLGSLDAETGSGHPGAETIVSLTGSASSACSVRIPPHEANAKAKRA